MKSCIKTELWKAFHNSYFIIALSAGMILVLCNVFKVYSIVQEVTQMTIEGQSVGMPYFNFNGCSLFVWWIAQNGITWGSVTFYTVWPILAAMPFSWSYAQEARSGSLIQYITRMNRKQYLTAKYLSVFIAGGIVVSLPVFADLLLSAMFCPDISLKFLNQLTPITDKSFLATIFFNRPWLHALIWCIVEFLFGGSAAVLAFLFGKKVSLSSVVILIPFIIMYILAVIGTVIAEITKTDLQLSPIMMAMQASLSYSPGWLIFSTLGLFCTISFGVAYFLVVKDDLL